MQQPSPSIAKRMRSPSKRMVAVYDYDPISLSPNVDAEVSDPPRNDVSFYK